MSKFPFFRQADAMDCGPTCLRIVSKYYGRSKRVDTLRNISNTTVEGTSLLGLTEAAEAIGFRTLPARITLEDLIREAPLPCIVHWNQNHFVVVYKITAKKIFVSDPAIGLTSYDKNEFVKNWIGTPGDADQPNGIVLLLEPTTAFYDQENEKESGYDGLDVIWRHAKIHRALFIQLSIALAAASVIQLIFPFLTQSIVDVGITNHDIEFVYIILAAQIFLFLGKTAVEFVRAWIPLHISTRINISLVSEFLVKLMRLPIGYFNGKVTGDILQRISDHRSVENLLSSTTLNAIFSVMNVFVFGAALWYYSSFIFFTFCIGTTVYVSWVLLFLRKRRTLNYMQFAEMSKNQSKIIELVNGMQEIKLHNAERQKRWEWEKIQVKLFQISSRVLGMEQTQSIGSAFINEAKNIAITVIAAKLVIEGEITLGMMLSISYMTGQLNAPVITLVNLIHSWQDARIGIERIGEVHSRPDEEPRSSLKIHEVSGSAVIGIRNVSFRYPGATQDVLQNVSFDIPPHKITAIVGASGCGKTTLMKILLKFYEPTSGDILVGNYLLRDIAQKEWRKYCGAVMQEGYIFNDTFANNVAVGMDHVEIGRLNDALEVANIQELIRSLPMSIHTKIGNEGIGLSTGQKQRVLIARAVYKSPSFVLFDEATSALDATSERVVMENLTRFLDGRTSVIIAHRLSTVMHADQIVVLGDGRVLEVGDHHELLARKGAYYRLVKNQLQLETLAAGTVETYSN